MGNLPSQTGPTSPIAPCHALSTPSTNPPPQKKRRRIPNKSRNKSADAFFTKAASHGPRFRLQAPTTSQKDTVALKKCGSMADSQSESLPWVSNAISSLSSAPDRPLPSPPFPHLPSSTRDSSAQPSWHLPPAMSTRSPAIPACHLILPIEWETPFATPDPNAPGHTYEGPLPQDVAGVHEARHVLHGSHLARLHRLDGVDGPLLPPVPAQQVTGVLAVGGRRTVHKAVPERDGGRGSGLNAPQADSSRPVTKAVCGKKRKWCAVRANRRTSGKWEFALRSQVLCHVEAPGANTRGTHACKAERNKQQGGWSECGVSSSAPQPHTPQARQPHTPTPRQAHTPTAAHPDSPTPPHPHTPTPPHPHTPTAPQPHSPKVPQPHTPTPPQPHTFDPP